MSEAKEQQKPEILLVAVDIEKSGSMMAKHPVVSVGFCIGNIDGSVIEKKRFNLIVQWFILNPGQDLHFWGAFEPRCVREFWSKQSEAMIQACGQNPLSSSQPDGWKEIAAYVDGLETRFPSREIIILSDNPSFDIGNIDHHLEKYANRAPMCYSSKGKYRSVKDASDMFSMMPAARQRESSDVIGDIAPYDHDPCDDAHSIMLQYVHAAEFKRRQEIPQFVSTSSPPRCTCYTACRADDCAALCAAQCNPMCLGVICKPCFAAGVLLCKEHTVTLISHPSRSSSSSSSSPPS